MSDTSFAVHQHDAWRFRYYMVQQCTAILSNMISCTICLEEAKKSNIVATLLGGHMNSLVHLTLTNRNRKHSATHSVENQSGPVVHKITLKCQ